MFMFKSKPINVAIKELKFSGIVSTSQLATLEWTLARVVDSRTAHAIFEGVCKKQVFAQQVTGTRWCSAYGGHVKYKV
jgi:hypothetical protein